MTRPILALALGLAAAGPSGAQEGPEFPPLWSHEFSSDIKHYEITAVGTVLVTTDDEMAVLDPATGGVLWTTDVLKDCNDNRAPIRMRRHVGEFVWCRRGGERFMQLDTYEALPIVLGASLRDLVVLDVATGDLIWDASQFDVSLDQIGWRVHELDATLIVWGEDRDSDGSVALRIDLASGEVRWRTEVPIREELARVIDDGPLVLVGEDDTRQRALAMVDIETGDLVRAGGFPLREDWEVVRPTDPLIVRGRATAGGDMVAGIDTDTGELLYTSTELGRYLDEDGAGRLVNDSRLRVAPTAVEEGIPEDLEILRGGDERLVAVDPRSGQIVWEPDRSRDITGWGYRSEVIYVTDDRGVAAYSIVDGSTVWEAQTDLWRLRSVDGAGVLLTNGSGRSLELLDLADGRSVWGAPVELEEEPDASIVLGDVLYTLSGNRLYRADLRTGAVREVAEVDFRGGEDPGRLRELEGGVLVLSAQNTVRVDAQGDFRYHRYYEAPGMSVWEKTARVALAAGETALSYQGARSRARYQAGLNALATGGSGVGYATYQVTHPDIGRRFRATSQFENQRYVYTEDPDAAGREGFSLVRLDLMTGEETGRAWIGQRRPDFVLDQIDQVAYVRDGKTLEAHGFQPSN